MGVREPNGGTISSQGTYTPAPASAGRYTVVAMWTPDNPAAGAPTRALAEVEVAAVPQREVELNPGFIEASGAVQMYGAMQNAAVVGLLVPSVVSADSNAVVQNRSSFVVPVACAKPRLALPIRGNSPNAQGGKRACVLDFGF